nr:amidohydrolase [uncultured Draconibacterium sp.]
MKNRRNRLVVYLLSALIALSIISCTEQQENEVKIYHGGTILTVDSDFSEAEAIAFQDDKILATGDLKSLKKAYGKKTEIVDLEGKTMLPGFIDPHAHVLSFAPVHFLTENIGITNFTTTNEALAHLKTIAAERAEGEWILGSGWDPSIQDGVSELTFKELNAISTEHPVFVMNTSGHLAYVNEKAYEVAGITEDVVNPPGAEFSRDENGKLNGVIKNNVAYLKVWLANPAAQSLDMTEALISLLNDFNKYGVTTTSEFALGGATQSAAEADLLFAATERDDFSARVMAYPLYTLSEKWDEAGTKMYDGNDLAKIVGFKFIADGSNQGYTGLQREPYFHPDHAQEYGIAYMSLEQLKEMAEYRAGQGWHMSLHGNGDAGIDNILDAMEYLKEQGYDLSKIRPRIEHCSILHDDQIERMKELGVSASFLIGHVHYWGTAMRDDVFGPEKAMLLDRAASVEKAGISYTLQSDFSVTEPDMLRMIQTAVERKTFKEPNYILNRDERVSVESAIRAVTIEAAWQMMSEDIIGSLEAGKYADYVILEEDPRKVDVSEISDIKVLETWMNGKQVYSAE